MFLLPHLWCGQVALAESHVCAREGMKHGSLTCEVASVRKDFRMHYISTVRGVKADEVQGAATLSKYCGGSTR